MEKVSVAFRHTPEGFVLRRFRVVVIVVIIIVVAAVLEIEVAICPVQEKGRPVESLAAPDDVASLIIMRGRRCRRGGRRGRRGSIVVFLNLDCQCSQCRNDGALTYNQLALILIIRIQRYREVPDMIFKLHVTRL